MVVWGKPTLRKVNHIRDKGLRNQKQTSSTEFCVILKKKLKETQRFIVRRIRPIGVHVIPRKYTIFTLIYHSNYIFIILSRCIKWYFKDIVIEFPNESLIFAFKFRVIFLTKILIEINICSVSTTTLVYKVGCP